ncbi:hypothetical protein DXA21_23190, partial [Parabacteroides distasonis]
WEIPENCGDEAYREALKRNLKVQVLALCNDNVDDAADGATYQDVKNSNAGDDAADGATYQDVKNSNAGEWLNLTQLYNERLLELRIKELASTKTQLLILENYLRNFMVIELL